jgi:hypothetical protein
MRIAFTSSQRSYPPKWVLVRRNFGKRSLGMYSDWVCLAYTGIGNVILAVNNKQPPRLFQGWNGLGCNRIRESMGMKVDDHLLFCIKKGFVFPAPLYFRPSGL